MNELRYTGIVKNGQLKITDRKGFDQDINSLEGVKVTLSVKKYRKQRSTAQNSYYFGCVIPAVQEGLIAMGFARVLSREDTHDILREKFLKEDLGNDNGEFITRTKSTTELTTTEFMIYTESVQEWAATFLNIVILDPNEQATLDI